MTERIVPIDPKLDLMMRIREARFIAERTDDPKVEEKQALKVRKLEKKLKKEWLKGSDKNE
jgi:hypothetical protein